MDTRLLTISFLVLALELCILLGDLGIIPLKLLPEEKLSQAERIEVGSIENIGNHVRRKLEHSFIWEDSKEKEGLYSYDSILTLDNSTADIKLSGDINIKLYENTLIVIEPPLKDLRDNSIHLKFAKGDLRSILKKRDLKLSSKNWSFNAKSGSDVSFRSLPGDQLEIEVNKGQLELENKASPGKKLKIQEGKALELSKDGIEKTFEKTKDLKWPKSLQKKQYTRTSSLEYEFVWEGYADQLEITHPNKTKSFHPLELTQRKITLNLKEGQYFARLQSAGRLSESIAIEILPSPSINYYYPFPRNRLLSDIENTFSWNRIAGAKSYRLELSREPSFEKVHEDYLSQHSFIQTRLQNRGPLYWRVVAIDEAGVEIHPQDSRILYSVSNALAAPKLKEFKKQRIPASLEEDSRSKNKQQKKNLRKKKERNSTEKKKDKTQSNIIWNLFKKVYQYIPEAMAQEKEVSKKFVYQFEWESVKGADFYIIEISKTNDFYNLLDTDKVNNSKYQWESSHIGEVYWRVAGGANDGTMGIFSESQKVVLSDIKVSKLKIASKKQELPKKSKPKNKPRPKAENVIPVVLNASVSPTKDSDQINSLEEKELRPKKELAEKESIVNSTQNKKKDNSYRVISGSWDLGYAKQQGRLWEESAGYRLVGLQPLSIELSYEDLSPDQNHLNYQIVFNYNRVEWKAKSEEDFPFQDKVTANDLSLSYYWTTKPKQRWGLFVRSRAVATRDSYENIKFENQSIAGISYWKAFEQKVEHIEKAEYVLQLGIGSAITEASGAISSLWTMKNTERYRMYFTSNFRFHARHDSESSKFSNHMELMFGLKVDWFFPPTQENPEQQGKP